MDIEKELRILRNLEKDIDILGKLTIIHYELGDVTKDIWYSMRFPNEKHTHLARVKSDLSDIIVQIRLLVNELGLDYRELEELGVKRMYERFKEFNERRWKISEIPIRKMYLDIEVLQQNNRFPDPERASEPIILITFYDNYLDKYITLVQRKDLDIKKEYVNNKWCIYTFNSETQMLKYFIKVIKRLFPDIITAWNSSFDIMYINNRLKNMNLYNNDLFCDIQVFDLLSGYKKINNIQNYTLGYVAKVEGLPHKTESAEDIPTLYRNEINRLIIYNYTDVKIIKELDYKHKILDMYWHLKSYVGTNDINDCFLFSKLLDVVLLRLAKDDNVCLPSKPSKSANIDKGYQGAIVFEPIEGIHNGVIVLDMSKFYPSIILSFNISPETYPDKQKEGIIPKMIKYLIEERKYYESQMENYVPGSKEYIALSQKRQIVKDLLNAVYGFLGYRRSRLFKQELAEFVTKIAREGLVWIKENIENIGYKVIYGDTDSVFVKIGIDNIDELVEIGKDITDIINTSLNDFAKKHDLKNHYFSIDFEKVYNPILFLSNVKKRYAGIVRWEKGKFTEYMNIRGFEVRRTDTSEITKDLQMNVLKMVLYGEEKNVIINYVREILNKIRSDSVSISELAISKGIQKNIMSYGTGGKPIPFHIRAVMYSNKYLGTKYNKGDKVKIVYIKHIEGYPTTNVLAFTDDIKLPNIIVDKEKMIDVTIKSKIEKILSLYGISWNEIEGRKTLTDLSG